jgi:hypothetical protein
MEWVRKRVREPAPCLREPVTADAETAAPRLTRLRAPGEAKRPYQACGKAAPRRKPGHGPLYMSSDLI